MLNSVTPTIPHLKPSLFLRGKTTKPGIRYVRLDSVLVPSCALIRGILFQVFIYYGPVSNSRLLRLYGFVVPGNSNDNYDLVLATHPEAPFLRESSSSGHRLDSIQPLLFPSLSPIRYQTMSFDTSVFSDRMHQNSLAWRVSESMLRRKSAIPTKWKSCGFWWNRLVVF